MPAQHPPYPLTEARAPSRLDQGRPVAQEHPAYQILPASAPTGLALVVDVPHSHGHWSHEGLNPAAAQALNALSDAYVDQFWFNACQARVPLLLARFHRALIDVNRAPTDIDPQLLCSPWPGALRPSFHSDRGVGLIRRWALPGVPVHDRLLTVAEVQARIGDFYEPYHQALDALIQQVQSRHGHCLHINAQGMKPMGDALNHDPGLPRPDFVVSNLNGLACAPALTCWVVDLLRSQGFEVWVNSHYMGAELIRRHAHPLLGRHGLQIEINQALYLDEPTGQPGPCFNHVALVLQCMIDGLAADPQRLATLCLPEGSSGTAESAL